MLSAFLHGFILASALIIPIGPQNLFIFNQGASQSSFTKSLPAVLTAAVADTILIIVAGLGLSILVFTIPLLQPLLYLIGVLFLFFIGWSIWKHDEKLVQKKKKPLTAKKQIVIALSISVLNPHAVLDTVAVIGTNASHYSIGVERLSFVTACILVSWMAFTLLAYLGSHLKQMDTHGKYMKWIHKASAVSIWLLALYFGIQALKNML
ncbi:LysE/ArgO family amino acid transporter [Shouchella lehensis]|uniref:Amino acid transporter n=1 Tax=Shouchella lehensis TaxID=300825 RepID=A0A4Y7WK21_9BACI|nr:LysE family transporter [Shouchella lehensis]MBG9785986.1 hypothetical protein [Shouchella lehensis]TES48465.1 amino acid transporter [Shouchella lehensis]